MTHRILAAAGLLAALSVADSATAITHVVSQQNFGFTPSNLVINVGDTVRWEWSSFSHTVTNGTGTTDPAVGTLFDAPLTGASPVFSYTFTAPGTVPYFCRPHLLMGMTGTVVVQAASGVDQVPVPGVLALSSAPNPFNPQTVISFVLPTAGPIRLTVHDAAGRLVRVLADGGDREAGPQTTVWDGRGDDGRAVPAGIYVATVEASPLRESVKLTLAK